MFLFVDLMMMMMICNGDEHNWIVGLSGAIDVLFAIDGSRLVGSKTFERMRQFIQGSVKAYNISADQTRIGLMVYGGATNTLLSFPNGVSKFSVEQALASAKPVGGERKMTDALTLADNEFFKVADRPGAAKLLILMTTGKNDQLDQVAVQNAVDALNRKKINILVIGVGKDIDNDELKRITNDQQNVVPVVTDENLPKAVTDVIEASGKAVGMLF